MLASEAFRIVQALADGIDPRDGTALPEASPCQHPQVLRALFVAAGELERRSRRQIRDAQLPEHAGAPWEEADDNDLARGYDDGGTIKQLAQHLKRTDGAIKRRLEKLGKLT